MAAIGAQTVTSFEGRLYLAERRMREIDAPSGVDGVGIGIGAWVATTATVTTGVAIAAGDYASKVNDYRNLVGTQVTVVDGAGGSWTSTLVLGVRCKGSYMPEGTVWLEADWTLLPNTVAPT